MKDPTKPFTNCLKEIIETQVHMCRRCPTFKSYFNDKEQEQLFSSYILEKSDSYENLWSDSHPVIAQLLIKLSVLKKPSMERRVEMLKAMEKVHQIALETLERETNWLFEDLYEVERANSPNYAWEQDEIIAERQHLANWNR